MRSYTLAAFWRHYRSLDREIQEQADKQFALFAQNPFHPSLQFKETGCYWSVRVSKDYRALARRKGGEVFWFWIGPHDEYEELIARG